MAECGLPYLSELGCITLSQGREGNDRKLEPPPTPSPSAPVTRSQSSKKRKLHETGQYAQVPDYGLSSELDPTSELSHHSAFEHISSPPRETFAEEMDIEPERKLDNEALPDLVESNDEESDEKSDVPSASDLKRMYPDESTGFHNIDNLDDVACVATFGLPAHDIRSFCHRLKWPSAALDKYLLPPLQQTKLFLVWFRIAMPQQVLAAAFGLESQQQPRVGETIRRVIDLATTNFVPCHLGFGPQHDIDLDKIISEEFQKEIACLIGKKVWDGHVVGVADGTYIYSQSIGDFFGHKYLYSTHKHRPLSKAMVVCTTRGYILDVYGGYGGRTKDNSDEAIWKDIITKAEAEIQEAKENESEAHNIVTFFRHIPNEKFIFVVDRGFRSADEVSPDHWEFKAPTGKHKVTVETRSGDMKEKEAPQHEALSANENRWVTILRNIVERINENALKRWAILGGVLDYRYLPIVDKLCKIAAAIWNCFQPGAFEKDGDLDVQDFNQLYKRRFHENWLENWNTEKYKFSGPKFSQLEQSGRASRRPWTKLTQEFIRKWSTSDYSCRLAKKYIRFARDHKRRCEFRLCTSRLPKSQCILLKFWGLKSRLSSAKVREVYLLWHNGDLRDTYCNCDGGLRSTGCAHAIATLFYLWELVNDEESVPLVASRKILTFMNADVDLSDESDSD